jgi:hypothetical protein
VLSYNESYSKSISVGLAGGGAFMAEEKRKGNGGKAGGEEHNLIFPLLNAIIKYK